MKYEDFKKAQELLDGLAYVKKYRRDLEGTIQTLDSSDYEMLGIQIMTPELACIARCKVERNHLIRFLQVEMSRREDEIDKNWQEFGEL